MKDDKDMIISNDDEKQTATSKNRVIFTDWAAGERF